MTTVPTTSAIAPWFGSNRTLAATVGRQLGKCAWVGIPFAGGCCEVPHIKTRAGVVNDKHRHLINLARVVADPTLWRAMVDRLDSTLFHSDEYEAAQVRCRDRETPVAGGLFGGGAMADGPDLEWAIDYFVLCWMGPSARAGTSTEFSGYFSVRWTSSGGDSAVRFRSAIASLEAWHKALQPWTFTTIDAFEFIGKCKDNPEHGLYCDSPWPEAGKEYAHGFTDAQQRRLASELSRFAQTRVVIRYGDHPLIRALYPEPRWTWIEQNSRNQGNSDVREVLIVNGAQPVAAVLACEVETAAAKGAQA